jgi:hypothetical protein
MHERGICQSSTNAGHTQGAPMMRRPRLTRQRYHTLCSALEYLQSHAEDMEISGDTAQARELFRQIESASEWLYKTAGIAGVDL